MHRSLSNLQTVVVIYTYVLEIRWLIHSYFFFMVKYIVYVHSCVFVLHNAIYICVCVVFLVLHE